jgi:D-amino-acid oxidase
MRIMVIGAGIVGLTSALRLQQAGHQVEVHAAEFTEHTTSAVAAALWYPYRALPERSVTRWSAIGFTVLRGLTDDARSGVRMRTGWQLFREPTPDPWWIYAIDSLGRVPDTALPAGYLDGYELTVPVVDMAVHLPWLQRSLTEAGIVFQQRRIVDLDEAGAGFDAVVNCAGLGAGPLGDDGSVVPVRGQVIVIEQIGLDRWLLDEGATLTYVVPRNDTILLGGTAEEGDDDSTVRSDTAAAIMQRCAALVPELRDAQVLNHKVGLRPGRPTVRLELQARASGPVVHCYGHGGAGVTLAYGCAEDVVGLIDQL